MEIALTILIYVLIGSIVIFGNLLLMMLLGYFAAKTKLIQAQTASETRLH